LLLWSYMIWRAPLEIFRFAGCSDFADFLTPRALKLNRCGISLFYTFNFAPSFPGKGPKAQNTWEKKT